MIPTYDENLKDPENAARFQEISQRADELLGLRRA
jgi:hypothetical protein